MESVDVCEAHLTGKIPRSGDTLLIEVVSRTPAGAPGWATGLLTETWKWRRHQLETGR